MPEPTSRLDRLRAGTRQAHARIETVPALARLQDAGLTLVGYAATLRALHAFHAAVEPMLAASLAAWPDAAALLDGARPRALRADLAWLGVAPLPFAEPPPAIDGPAGALGALYVIEGSGLGGRVIARAVGASLGVAPGAGGSFYGGLSAEAARARWQRLCAALDGCVAPGAAAEAALLAGALATFEGLERWLRCAPAEALRLRPTAAIAA